VSLRIITGALKGREVFLPKGATFRPSTHFLREMVFSIITPQAVEGCIFLDVFAGSGVVGIEALSRGAAKAIFLEKAYKTSENIRLNLKRMGVEDRGFVVKADATRELPVVGRVLNPGELIDIVFVDPPFSSPLEIAFLASAVRNRHLFQAQCTIYMETRFAPKNLPDGLEVIGQRKTSSSMLTTLVFNTGKPG
jgi:16S rRNA (guanine966-N2)-methyltransferase